MSLRIRIHTDSGIGHRQHHVFAGRQHVWAAVKESSNSTLAVSMVRRPPLGHGIPGIHREIQNNLFDLAAVRFDQTEILFGTGLELDIFADQPAQDLFHLADHILDVQIFRRENLFAAECEQLLRKRVARCEAI